MQQSKALVQPSIQSQSRQCLQLFETLSLLQDEKGLSDSTNFRDESARFLLWANNIGALLPSRQRNSLDSRLSNAQKMSSRIIEFLSDLAEALEDARLILTEAKPNRSTISPGQSSGSSTSELLETFGTTKDTVTSLMKTSIIIRDATPRDRYLQSSLSTKNPFVDSFDISHVAHKFPKLDLNERQWLKERLGKAITQRRQYLKYSRDHHNRFQEEEAPRSEGLSSDYISEYDGKPGQQASNTVKSLPVSTYAPTDASTLQISKLKPFEEVLNEGTENVSDTVSQTSYATSVHEDDDESKIYPPRLKEITNTFPFECPYCWNLQEIRNERSWRKHLFADLRPYVVDRIPAADCLLCDWESVLRQSNTAASPNETLVVTLDQFCRHVGSHMEQLALFALPRSIKDQGAEGDSNEAAAAADSDTSPLGTIGQRTLSWKSISSIEAAQDHAIPDLAVYENPKSSGETQPQAAPDLAVDKNPKSFADLTSSSTKKPSLYAWSSSNLTHKPMHGQAGFPMMRTQWIGGAYGQNCFKGKIYIHCGLVNGPNLEDNTCVIDMSEEKGIVSFLGQGPGPRENAAGVFCGFWHAFIVFGGRLPPTGDFDTTLYWLDPSICLGFS
ncbi:MAG: hypothetical protein Q9195_007342 [Heterodermia aff. obscurata]